MRGLPLPLSSRSEISLCALSMPTDTARSVRSSSQSISNSAKVRDLLLTVQGVCLVVRENPGCVSRGPQA